MDIYRNYFHIEPEKGLLNDPNGLIQFRGRYYFFHQWNRFATNHDYKEWGLFTSVDLLNWDNQGSAILPDSEDDKDGIYSGSATEKDGELFLFYTGNTKKNGIRKSYQKISRSVDGQTFIKEKKTIQTPVGFTEHYRDPKVWYHNEKWWMVIGAQTDRLQGAVALHSSKDLLSWDYEGIFYEDGSLEQMCECPDVFSVSEGVDILMVCPQKRSLEDGIDCDLSSFSGYLVGNINYEKRKFIKNKELRPVDHGFDFYAPQSFLDAKGRRIIIGWMSRMGSKEEELCPTKEHGYLHCLTIPREMKWRNDKLYQVPVDEFKQLRKQKEEFFVYSKKIDDIKGAFEMILNLENKMTDFLLTLHSKTVVIEYKDGLLIISRLNWVSEKYESKCIELSRLYKIQLFNDYSAMEIFINDGEYVFSMRYFSKENIRNIQYHNFNEKSSIILYNY
ncbi:glycoside hydrolase family 32 protein [Enterococcus casseliflavus]|uniref:glycoside hydrolase family 32 protein n=1 Tax=Enterococcus casseliflavus TaxID=37734 RepID=UPI0022E8D91F|nr:glycoside hydrolase family 32 protein [Enterococcus casseliflavus]